MTRSMRYLLERIVVVAGSLPKGVIVGILFVPYATYIAFLLKTGTAPVDYDTFMNTGEKFLSGQQVYGENSYYPMPYVMIFALFKMMPQPMSIVLWLGLPIIIAYVASGFEPLVLLFAPLFSHFSGGQASAVCLLGFWGYRRSLGLNQYRGGMLLALTMLKPQLGIVPVAYAGHSWIQHFRRTRTIPAQLYGFVGVLSVMFLPTFLAFPGWLSEWLSTPRPLLERALSAMIPRLLIGLLSPHAIGYWIVWGILALGCLAVVWRRRTGKASLDVLMLWSFTASPLVHDYDLIELIPVIHESGMWRAAVLVSLPGWWTMITNYANDRAWITFTIIAPGLLLAYLLQTRRQ
jgi:hypothetical protein